MREGREEGCTTTPPSMVAIIVLPVLVLCSMKLLQVFSSVMSRKSSKGRSRWRRALSRVRRKEGVEARYSMP